MPRPAPRVAPATSATFPSRSDMTELLLIAPRRDDEAPRQRLGRVVEPAGVGPAALLVEATRAEVAGHHREPGAVEALGDAPLAGGEERGGDAGAAGRRGDEELLELVLVHAGEADDGAADRRQRRELDARRHAREEVVEPDAPRGRAGRGRGGRRSRPGA